MNFTAVVETPAKDTFVCGCTVTGAECKNDGDTSCCYERRLIDNAYWDPSAADATLPKEVGGDDTSSEYRY
ncbi:MAG: hypothetical protein ACLR6J_14435 [Parabacteroides merdae]